MVWLGSGVVAVALPGYMCDMKCKRWKKMNSHLIYSRWQIIIIILIKIISKME